MSHPFGDLLRQYRARKAGLSQTRLAHLAGYDQAILARMAQGKKDLTGPSGRERVVRIISVLRDNGAIATLDEANALLKAAAMPALFEGQPEEVALIKALAPESSAAIQAAPAPAAVTPTVPERPWTNLPVQLTHFVGREREMVEVINILATARLLTLTGSGGAGKTRLAIEVASSFVGSTTGAQRVQTYPDGVWLVEFASLVEDRLVVDSVAAALGLQAMSRTPLEVLTGFLRDKQMLLILDNCEHLLHGCAELAVALLQACSHLHLLVTSREPLNVPGEVTWRVPSLSPEEGVQLFTERARAANPAFQVTPANTSVIAHLCWRLDYMPLALELAAARLRAFSVEQIAARLDDVFRLLTGGSRIALPRQQTLQATIDWSYNLLTDSERTLLHRLSVFAGGWTLEAAEAIYEANVLGLLDSLVNKSLVVVEEHPTGMRYRMLETIRQYAHEKLAGAGEEDHARMLHLVYYTHLSRMAGSQFAGGPEERERMWNETMAVEVDNARAAFSWAAQCGDWQAVIEGAPLFVDYLSTSTHGYPNEVRQWVDAAILSNPQASDTARAKGLLYIAGVLIDLGDLVGCIDWYRQASTLTHQLGDELLILEADMMLGYVTPDYQEAIALLQQVIQRGRQVGWKSVSIAVTQLGHRMGMHGDYVQAAELLERCVALTRSTSHQQVNLAYVLWRLGQVYLGRADYARARAVLEESVDLNRKSFWNQPATLIDLGTAAVATGDYGLVRETFGGFFPNFYNRDNLERIAQGLVLAAALAQALGKLTESACLLGAAAAIRRDHHTHGVFERELFAEYDRCLPAVRAAMAPADFEQAWAEGQKLTVKEAIAEALAI